MEAPQLKFKQVILILCIFATLYCTITGIGIASGYVFDRNYNFVTGECDYWFCKNDKINGTSDALCSYKTIEHLCGGCLATGSISTITIIGVLLATFFIIVFIYDIVRLLIRKSCDKSYNNIDATYPV